MAGGKVVFVRIITDPDEARRAFEPWRKQHAQPAWRPVTEPGEGPVAASHFGGRPALLPGEPWPTCKACGHPQTLFLQLDLDRLPPDAGDFGGGLLQFFYCTDCNDGDVDPSLPFSDAHLLRRLRDVGELSLGTLAAAGEGADLVEWLEPRTIVGWTAFDDGPHYEEVEDLGLQVVKANRANEPWQLHWPAGKVAAIDAEGEFPHVIGAAEGDKLGGWPYWVQSWRWVACPKCEAIMRLLVQIDSDGSLPFMFGDSGVGHVMQCPNHPDVLSFAWDGC